MKRHMRSMHSEKDEDGIHSLKYHNGFCVENKQGLYLVSQTLRGPQHPIHVHEYKHG